MIMSGISTSSEKRLPMPIPINYKKISEYTDLGESSDLEEFCEKAQLLNIEVMKGMYEAWNDKMWNDAAGILIWMSHPCYPSFVWQTYDYYYDPTGAYWGSESLRAFAYSMELIQQQHKGCEYYCRRPGRSNA